MSASPAQLRDARALLREERAFAAVEFALMLPLVLVIYLGLAELALGQRASQRLDLVAHTLSDLTAQQLTGGSFSGQAGMDETTIQAIFSAATTLMSPLPTTNLKMTISEVTVSADATQTSGFKASVNWTIAKNSGTLRPCKINNVAKLNAADVAPVDPNSMPTSYTSAKSVTLSNAGGGTTTTSVTPTVGSIIVADVIYSYQPSFSRTITWMKTAAPQMSRTSYSPVRNTYSPNHVQYYMTSGTNCTPGTP
ncbi:pilus assembly protein TadE [Methylosinus sp. R-45379]|uniref:TadE/TadG family type IV pilus assembly protein n=1 Tax=unclassified Methylosinus TaxID=2624500 RepID=UPI000466A0ED|nr:MULTISPECIES: TadE/TadG family type IV pilus assembly protein [unclassified Methylosinus]OAI30483.1 pilus assembly protein TadE [Methylosinus sp. R-45379]